MPDVNLVRTENHGGYRQPTWAMQQLSLLVWDSSIWMKLLVAAPLALAVLLCASLLMASVPVSRGAKPKPALQLAREEFTPPMVRLLEEMSKADATQALPGTREISLVESPIAKPFLYLGVSDGRERAAACLATAAWYEAGNDLSGQRAVMQVVLNRLRHPSFPKSVCGVVFQGSERSTGCQFSFTCDGSMNRRIPQPAAWAQVRMLAEGALSGAVDPVVREATHFHADYVSPYWAPKLQRIVKVGAHIFYRWGGAQGEPGSDKLVTLKEDVPLAAMAGSATPLARVTAATRAASEANVRLDYNMEPEVTLAAKAGPHSGLKPGTGAMEASMLAIHAKPVDAAPARANLMYVDANGPVARWAITAMDRCADSGACRVIAYSQVEQVERNRKLLAAVMERPLFLFVRDASGMQLALWDCDRAPRPKAEQCLPQGPELTALLGAR